MRTTLDIDDDILAAAKDLAKAEGKTAGQVLSDLARRAVTTPSMGQPGLAEGQADYMEDAWVTLPGRTGVLITPEHIQRVQDEIDEEDARRYSCDDQRKRSK